LQIGCVEALGEPAVERRQQFVGLGPLALLLPQAAQAHGSPQLQRFGLLETGDIQGALEPGFHRFLGCLRLLQEQNTPQAIDFGFQPALLMLLYQRLGFGQCLEAGGRVPGAGTDVR
jgi:hypothetical protein